MHADWALKQEYHYGLSFLTIILFGNPKTMNNNSPLLLVPPNDPIVQKWTPAFQNLEQSQDALVFTVNPTIMAEGEVAYIQEMIMALQHHPHLIERMIFSIKFRFKLVDDVEVEVSENEWKSRTEVYSWFFKMSSLPMTVYFISDQDARGYCLFGDFLASGSFDTEDEADGLNKSVGFTEAQVQQIADRLFNGAWALLMYCHNTGFTPDPYIDALLADYDMPFTVADVRRKYEEDVVKGFSFRMKPQ